MGSVGTGALERGHSLATDLGRHVEPEPFEHLLDQAKGESAGLSRTPSIAPAR